jgi:putative aldouronate transport system permease protein
MRTRDLRNRSKHPVTFGSVALYVVLSIVFIVSAYPFVYVLSLAVMPYQNYINSAIHLFPDGFTIDYFRQVISEPRVVTAFAVSILKTVIGTILSVFFTVTAGFALSRPTLPYSRPLTMLFLLPLYLSGGLIPFFLVIRGLGLLDTFWALVLPNMVAAFYLLITRTYFINYPQELLDAARVDGAGHWLTFWKVAWPTSTPIIATLAVLYGVGHWNDFFWPSLLVQSDLQPATVLLQGLISNRTVLSQIGGASAGASQSYIAAIAAVLIVPVLIVYPIMQRFFIRGIMIGSIKG